MNPVFKLFSLLILYLYRAFPPSPLPSLLTLTALIYLEFKLDFNYRPYHYLLFDAVDFLLILITHRYSIITMLGLDFKGDGDQFSE